MALLGPKEPLTFPSVLRRPLVSKYESVPPMIWESAGERSVRASSDQDGLVAVQSSVQFQMQSWTVSLWNEEEAAATPVERRTMLSNESNPG